MCLACLSCLFKFSTIAILSGDQQLVGFNPKAEAASEVARNCPDAATACLDLEFGCLPCCNADRVLLGLLPYSGFKGLGLKGVLGKVLMLRVTAFCLCRGL